MSQSHLFRLLKQGRYWLFNPRNTHLTGSVLQTKPARWFARNGKLRFTFRQIELQPGMAAQAAPAHPSNAIEPQSQPATQASPHRESTPQLLSRPIHGQMTATKAAPGQDDCNRESRANLPAANGLPARLPCSERGIATHTFRRYPQHGWISCDRTCKSIRPVTRAVTCQQHNPGQSVNTVVPPSIRHRLPTPCGKQGVME